MESLPNIEKLDLFHLLNYLHNHGKLFNLIYSKYPNIDILNKEGFEGYCTDCLTTYKLLINLFTYNLPKEIEYEGIEILPKIDIVGNKRYNVKLIATGNRELFYTVTPLLSELLKEYGFCSIEINNILYDWEFHFMNLIL
jgi:hypothetical protein